MKFLRFLPVVALFAMAACNSGSTTANEGAAADSVEAAADEAPATETAAPAGEVVRVATPSDNPEPTDAKAVVIDFSAVWCGPCQQFKPVYHAVAGEYAAKADFFAADVDECPDLAKKYDISNIPCVVILKKGAEPVKHVGSMSDAEFKDLLNKSL
ncbi:MAG: thioredoxin family protein [Paramuribaculum sp.]|nr:thioredoxin family protein [Paramuribaculum sp.]